jgi:hypothetical protein
LSALDTASSSDGALTLRLLPRQTGARRHQSVLTILHWAFSLIANVNISCFYIKAEIIINRWLS